MQEAGHRVPDRLYGLRHRPSMPDVPGSVVFLRARRSRLYGQPRGHRAVPGRRPQQVLRTRQFLR
ncbi:hypothetical protein NC652_030371 [Populus alba x Populus x berolinensis]|nr:hypothetical protein NC652_030371 [Populus alba x Populus x berolinensis]